jgi:hypothetical protein
MVTLATKISTQRKLISDLNKRWNLYIKIEKTFDRNGIISDMKGKIKATKNVAKIAKEYEKATEKLDMLLGMV